MNNINLPKTLVSLGYTLNDFVIKDNLDGNGQYISSWFHNDPQPSEQNLIDEYANILANENAELIPTAKALAKREIDIAAETARAKYITLGSGQAMAYQEKGEEAADYVTAGYPVDLSNYPWIQAEVDATGKTSTQAADDILSTKSTWVTVGAQIEKERLLGKITVENAIDIDAVNTAKNTAITLLQAI